MNELGLFAGAGGGLLASKWLLGHTVVAYVEKETYCQEVIQARIKDGFLDDAPIWSDVRTFDGRPWRGVVDCVSAGFPCQPFSVAGKQDGEDDARNCWPDTARIISEVQPEWAFLENVPGLLAVRGGDGRSYIGRILGDLCELGYDAEWTVFSAADAGAPHLRKRLWILAHAKKQHRTFEGCETFKFGCCGEGAPGEARHAAQFCGTVSDGNKSNVEGIGANDAAQRRKVARGSAGLLHGTESRRLPNWWATEPRLGRVAYGVARRVDRLKAIGNGQVSLVAALAWRELMGRYGQKAEG